MNWILQKHPPNPFGPFQSRGRGYLAAFTIAGVYKNRQSCIDEAINKNKNGKFLFIVKKLSKAKK